MAETKNFKDKVIEKLNEKQIKANCEICTKNDWALVDQPVSINITDLSGNLRIPMPQVPSAAMICNHCGNIRLFALGVLGLIPKPQTPINATKGGK